MDDSLDEELIVLLVAARQVLGNTKGLRMVRESRRGPLVGLCRLTLDLVAMPDR
jgi:hypothetical protein